MTRDDVDGDATINTGVNKRAVVSGYILRADLYERAKSYAEININLSDLGINILLINFAKYYAKSQYHLFVYQFEEICEIENFEQKLLQCSRFFIKLPKNLSVHEFYGLKANASRFINVGSMSVKYFEDVIAYMSSKIVKPDDFVKNISVYHISIIETLYAFASFTRQNRVILDCRDLHTNKLNYMFPKIYKITEYTGIFWFVVPRHAVWFVYCKGLMKKFNYITRREEENLHQTLKQVNMIVLGFVYNGAIFPVKLDDPIYLGQWVKTVEYFKHQNFNIVFQTGYPTYKHSYFVTEKQDSIYQHA